MPTEGIAAAETGSPYGVDFSASLVYISGAAAGPVRRPR